MANPSVGTGVATGKAARSTPISHEPGVVFREDDDSFKDRLKHNLMNHWLINTTSTLVVFTLVFWVLTDDLLVGVLAGVLVLGVSNLYNVLWRIKEFERWEIFSNGVKLGYDPRGQLKFIKFSDIQGLRVSRGPFGEVLVIDMGKRRLRYKYTAQSEVFDLLRERYEAFKSIKGPSPGAPT